MVQVKALSRVKRRVSHNSGSYGRYEASCNGGVGQEDLRHVWLKSGCDGQSEVRSCRVI
jgi:hypothetical protein